MKRSVVFVSLAGALAFVAGVFACDGGDGDGEVAYDQLSGQDDAIEQCVQLCEYALADDLDLSDGPCLSEEVVDDWVCDVAHNPRIDADDLDTNQCDNFGEGAMHFVEVTPECDLIKSN